MQFLEFMGGFNLLHTNFYNVIISISMVQNILIIRGLPAINNITSVFLSSFFCPTVSRRLERWQIALIVIGAITLELAILHANVHEASRELICEQITITSLLVTT